MRRTLIDLAIAEMKGQTFRVPSKAELDAYFTGCGGPWTESDNTTSWCGIFMCYLLRKGGAKVSWVMGAGIHNQVGSGSGNPGGDISVVRYSGNQGCRKGDILVRDRGQHHFLALVEPTSTAVIPCVEGNYGGPGNPMLHHGSNWKNQLGRVHTYYRVVL